MNDFDEGRNRSSFELTEAGANNVLIDSLQFEIDGLFSASSLHSTRRRCIWKIVSIVQSNKNIFLSINNGFIKQIMLISRLLKTEKDEFVRSGLIALSFVLCHNERDLCSFCNLLPPVDVVDILLNEAARCIVSHISGTTIHKESEKEAIALHETVDTDEKKEENKQYFHKKRLFKGNRVQRGSSNDQGLRSTFAIIDLSLSAAPKFKGNIMNQEPNNLRKIFPSVFLVATDNNCNSDISRITDQINSNTHTSTIQLTAPSNISSVSDSAFLSLLIVNRYVAFAVQRLSSSSKRVNIDLGMVGASVDDHKDVGDKMYRGMNLDESDDYRNRIDRSFIECFQQLLLSSKESKDSFNALCSFISPVEVESIIETNAVSNNKSLSPDSLNGRSLSQFSDSIDLISSPSHTRRYRYMQQMAWLVLGLLESVCYKCNGVQVWG